MRDWRLQQLDRVIQFGERVAGYDKEVKEYTIIGTDDNFCKMLGFTKDELFLQCRGKIRELIYPPDIERLDHQILEDLEGKEEYTAQFRMRRKDGDLIWVWERGTIETDLDGNKQLRSLTVNIDYTKRVRQERDILLENSLVGIIRLLITETNFYILQTNEECLNLLGTTREEYEGSSGMFTFPEDLPNVRAHLTSVAREKKPIEYTFRCYRGDGSEMWMNLRGKFYEEKEDGREYLCVFLNVTERQRHISQLEREREKYRLAMQIVSDYLFEYDFGTGKLSYYGENPNNKYIPCIEEGIYKTGREIMQKNNFVYPEDFEKCHMLIKEHTGTVVRIRLLTRQCEKNELSYEWYDVEIKPVWREGCLVSVMGSLRHIEKLKREMRRRSDLRNLYEIQADKIFEIIIYINAKSGRIRGYLSNGEIFEDKFPDESFEAFVEKNALLYVHPEEQVRYRQSMQLSHMQEVLKLDAAEETLCFRIRRGVDEEYRYKCVKYSYLGGNPEVIIITGQDMNQFYETHSYEEDASRKLLESAMKEKESSGDVRRNFSMMIAKELYAPLQFVEMSLREHGEDEENKDVYDAIQYARKVVDNIREYERLDSGQIKFSNRRFDMEHTFMNVVRAHRMNSERLGINIIFRLSLQERYFYGDGVRIDQILNNALGNAVMASEGGGKVTIWAYDEDQGDGISLLHVTIEDTGIPVQQSFFGRDYKSSAKRNKSMWEIGNNSGGAAFSLLLSRKLTDLMGGRILLNRKRDRINTIDIALPLKRVKEAKDISIRSDGYESCERDLSGYTILLIENTEDREHLHGPMLKLCGAGVELAGSGEEAIRLWEHYPKDRFQVILVNGNPVDMDFIEFAEWFRSLSSREAREIPIIALADNVEQYLVRQSMRAGVNTILPRIIDIKRLEKVLEMFEKERGERDCQE